MIIRQELTYMKTSKPVEWKKKLFRCVEIKQKGKMIPLHEMLGITEEQLAELRNAKKNSR